MKHRKTPFSPKKPPPRAPWVIPGVAPWIAPWIVLSIVLWAVPPAGSVSAQGLIPPLAVDILDAAEKPIAKALIYPNYVELVDAAERPKGSIGVVMVQGRARLFVVRADRSRALVGWAEGRRLFNAKGVLIGYYHWTPIRSYVYDKDMKLVGQAKCLAYQGVCAAGVAGFLLGLL